MTNKPSHPALSSTVLLLRDFNNSLQVLIVRRNNKLKTAGGLWVFPGGRIDDIDFQGKEDNFLAAKNGAVRETLEETGITIPFSGLTPFAHWTTPVGVPRRFATWFFAACVKDGEEIQVDGSEIVDYKWLTPSEAIELQAKDEISIMPPTYISLREVVEHNDSRSAFQALEAKQVLHFNPKSIPGRNGESVIVYDNDAAYDNALIDTPGRRNRIYKDSNGWHHECSE